MPQNRLTELEIHVADLEKTVSELNDVLTDQWRIIDQLKRQNRLLDGRLTRLEQAWSDQPQAKPPHY